MLYKKWYDVREKTKKLAICNRQLTFFQAHLVVVNRFFCYDLPKLDRAGNTI